MDTFILIGAYETATRAVEWQGSWISSPNGIVQDEKEQKYIISCNNYVHFLNVSILNANKD